MKKIFKNWNIFEISLLIISIILILSSGIFLEGNILAIIMSILSITTAILQAKGKVLSQFIGFVVAIFYSILSFNKYEDDEYIIYPATSIQDLVEESRQQKNCVRTYCEAISNNESQIYFMRRKEELDKSFVTIEVNDKKIIQARVKYNELPSKEINEILNKWEQNLIPITNN